MNVHALRVAPSEHGVTLRDFLALRLRLSNKGAKQLLDTRSVFVNGRRIWMARHPLNRGDRVEVLAVAPAPPAITRAAVLLETDDYVVVNKPPGILSNGPGSAETGLQAALRLPGVAAVHRLDRDTSGCLLFAKHPAARAHAIRVFRERRVTKTYRALVLGNMRGIRRTVSIPIQQQQAVTHLRVLDAAPRASHVEAQLETGRTHQLRRHLQAIGHPVLGDREYAAGRILPPELRQVPRQMLHALRLELPLSGGARPLICVAPLPEDFQAWLSRLGLRHM